MEGLPYRSLHALPGRIMVEADGMFQVPHRSTQVRVLTSVNPVFLPSFLRPSTFALDPTAQHKRAVSALPTSALDIKLRTEYLEDLEVVDPTDFVSRANGRRRRRRRMGDRATGGRPVVRATPKEW